MCSPCSASPVQWFPERVYSDTQWLEILTISSAIRSSPCVPSLNRSIVWLVGLTWKVCLLLMDWPRLSFANHREALLRVLLAMRSEFGNVT